MNAAPPLVFLSCGGTIEKIVMPDTGQLGFDRSHLSEWLEQCRLGQPWRSETWMLIDSLDMTASHREALATHIAAMVEQRIVVVHGTDTMVESAAAVMLQRKAHQTVVFTGAMIPVSASASDGLFNLGMATAAAQSLPPGVYIAMSGQVFAADHVRKNRSLARFESSPPNSAAQHEKRSEPNASEDSSTVHIGRRRMTGFFR
jgi:L-asparaginase